MQQQSDFYSYLLDGSSQPQQQPQPQQQDQYYNNNSNTFPVPSQIDSFDTQQQQQALEKAESSTNAASSATSAVALKGGTDFRRRKNWSERILVEITGLLHVLSPTGKILYCSESTHELTGYRPHELVGQALMDFLHVDDMDVFIRDFQMSFHTRSQIKTHYRFRKKDDTYVIFEVVGHPKADVLGQPPQSFFGIAQPVPTKSGALIDAFLELKAENNWLKKRIGELSLKYGKVDTTSPSSSTQHDDINNTNNNNIDTNNTYNNNNNNASSSSANNNGSAANLSKDWNDTSGGGNNHTSDLDEFMSGYKEEQKEYGNSSSGLATHQESADRKDKWKRRKKHKGADEYVCADCGTTSSPEWRKGPHGPKTLCNACGLRWAKKNKKRDLNDD